MLFIGVEPSRSASEPSGVAVLSGDEFGCHLLSAAATSVNDEVIAIIERSAHGRPLLVAIDAPLVMGKGKREADELLGVLFGEREAKGAARGRRAAHARAVRLLASLQEIGIIHDPSLKAFERSRKCFETSPLPAIAVFMGAGIPSRAREKRPLGVVLWELQRGLERLKDLHLPWEFTRLPVEDLTGAGLRERGIVLDALLCAYTAYVAWAHPGRCELLGNLREGYVLAPVLKDKGPQVEGLLPKA